MKKQFRPLLIAGLMLVIFAIALMTPTIKTTRAIEVRGELESTALSLDSPLTNIIQAPAGNLSYVIVWVQEGPGIRPPKAVDYKTTTLDVKTSSGQATRIAARPSLIKREDKAALLFKFKTLKITPAEPLIITLRQTGPNAIMVRRPLPDNIKAGEIATAALQLGERKNWLTLLIDKVYAERLEGKDIASYLHRGQQIVEGSNPYSCVLEEGSCIGYPAHLPGMYLVAAGFVAAGVNDLSDWTMAWRPLVFAAWLSIGALLFVYIFKRKKPALAVAVLGFWLFNRWSLEVLRIAHTDFFGVLFLLLAVILAWRWPRRAALLFGASLAVKQLALLAAPIFLLTLWRQNNRSWPNKIILAALVLALPLAASLPFLIDNPKATLIGWLNVSERDAQVVHGFAPSFDAWLDVTGPGKWLIMIYLLAAAYVAAWHRSINLIEGTFIVMAITMAFAPTLYNQYFVWFVALIPLALAQRVRKVDSSASKVLS